jgi:hypothetical protein
MTESGFLQLKSEVLKMLHEGLDPALTYHCPAHTEDVLQQVERIAAAENITENRVVMLMRIAAIFHDTGFLRTYKGHEEASCRVLLEVIDKSMFDAGELEMMQGMIMATKIPQQPATLPEMIICDADLDYLGRDDFFPISETLKNEFLVYGIIQNESQWDRLQVSFFESHHYFTKSSLHDRHPIKKQHYERLRKKLEAQ